MCSWPRNIPGYLRVWRRDRGKMHNRYARALKFSKYMLRSVPHARGFKLNLMGRVLIRLT